MLMWNNIAALKVLSKYCQFLQNINYLYGYGKYKSSNVNQALNNSLYICRAF